MWAAANGRSRVDGDEKIGGVAGLARMIDSSYLLKHQRKVKFFGLGPDDESWGYAVPVEVIEKAPTLTQPNEPLTLEELREMDGDPVWFDTIKRWGIVRVCGYGISVLTKSGEYDVTRMKFYRRPPEVLKNE